MNRAVIVFRQERDERRHSLFQEIIRGRLRQGWGYQPTFDLRQDKRTWMRAYKRHPVKGDAPKSTYEKIAGMLKIQPGDLLVVPNQPNDNGFLTCEAVASNGGGGFPCYDFIGAVHGDFRHCTSINSASVHQYRYSSVAPALRAALTEGYYRSPVQFVRIPELAAQFLKLTLKNGRKSSISSPPSRVSPCRQHIYGDPALAPFQPKPDSDCLARIRGGLQTKTRQHEGLVRNAGAYLKRQSVAVHTPHPIDLYASRPRKIIFEAKIIKGNPAARVREAVGQLYWYRYKYGPRDASLCVLLDKKPSQSIIDFVEDGLNLMVVWMDGKRVVGGPKTVEVLASLAHE